MVSARVATVLSTLDTFTSMRAVSVARNILTILASPPSDGGTPRQTGFASSNWIASIGQAHEGVAGSKQNVSRAEQNASLSALSGYRTSQGEIVVANNVPYIGRLNAGSSNQAPPGFIQAAIARGTAEA